MAEEERERRLDRFYRPYHDAVGAMIASVAAASGKAPFIFSVHSFTPVMQGFVRPWHVGVLWDRDSRVARPLIDALAADPLLVVGDNEPYDGALRGDTMYRHAIVNGFAHALVEIRQDLIADDSGATAYEATSPVAGLGWRPTPRMLLFAAWGRGFETPTFNELGYRADGGSGLNLALRAARSEHAEGGLRFASAHAAAWFCTEASRR